MTRRFVCPLDPAWRRFHGALCVMGGVAAMVALLAQALAWLPLPAAWSWARGDMGMVLLASVLVLMLLVVVAAIAVSRASLPSARASGHAGRWVECWRGDRDAHGPGLLRWDTHQWWWHPPAARHALRATGDQGPGQGHRLTGAPLAVTPLVLLDLEHWMLLRLVPAGAGWRFWRHRLLAVSRRQLHQAGKGGQGGSPGQSGQSGHWSLLRIHLFTARA